MEVSGLLTSGFLAAVTSGLTFVSLGRFRKTGVLLTTVCGVVWQPLSLTLLILWARASFTSLPKALPSWCWNYSVQLSVYLVSSRSCFNSCKTSAILSLIFRNMFFSSCKIHPSFEPFPQSWTCVSSQSEATRTGNLFAASHQTSQSNRTLPLLSTYLRTIPRTYFCLNHFSIYYSHDQLRKYKVHPCRARMQR